MSIQNTFARYWIKISSSEEVLFENFLHLFQEYNVHTNLSAIRDEAEIIEKHFVDSLMLERFHEIKWRVLDIGTGGGFPGIPLKIRHPDSEFVLLDSVGKKIRACEYFSRELGLEGIECIHGRAEEYDKGAQKRRDFREKWAPERGVQTYDEWGSGILNAKTEFFRTFDLVVSRATAYLPQILEWSEPFLSVDGTIVLYKLPSEEEMHDGLKSAKRLGLRLIRSEDYILVGQERVLLFFSRA